MSVASEGAPVPLVFNVSVAVKLPVAPPSAAVVETRSVNVCASFTVKLHIPLPACVNDALLVVSTRLAENDSGPSTNWSSVAVTVSVTVFPLTAPLLNDFVSDLYSALSLHDALPISVASEGAPVPLVFNVSVAVKLPVAPPSAAVV